MKKRKPYFIKTNEKITPTNSWKDKLKIAFGLLLFIILNIGSLWWFFKAFSYFIKNIFYTGDVFVFKKNSMLLLGVFIGGFPLLISMLYRVILSKKMTHWG